MPELVPEDPVIVLFGATGDLASRKLLPGRVTLSDDGFARSQGLPSRVRGQAVADGLSAARTRAPNRLSVPAPSMRNTP